MSSEEDNLNSLHKVYTNDPLLFMTYVGKEVKIMTKDKNVYYGIVYTLDPVSESIVLLHPQTDTQYHLKIIFNHAIKDIEVISKTERFIPELFLPAKLSQTMITKRKNIVMQLLLNNRFPVKEENDVLLIEDSVSIEPPYYPENCTCANSIVLTRIQNILTHVNIE
ncbi:Gem-associated protein 6 [Camponotus floridanus]|uniref:Gem-associated protein 6 n=1 Tax=Camponotus floridanus TaxID=104421 RepID=E1ZZF2_CAMFO|nr:gem-associated protein 6 [Camponotus floridanus]EFN73444.1 Gem-associated protein 6 [Camponotus floridanus]